MTRGYAIDELNDRIKSAEFVDSDYIDCVSVDAVKMAISALSVPETNVGDMISRQAAIDSIMEEPSETRYPVYYTEKIKQLPSAQPEDICGECDAWNQFKNYPRKPQWIPVSERLPIPNERIGNVRKYYLIQNEYGDMMVACYSGEWEQIYRHEYCLDKVVAWMPLPTPFREGVKHD